MASYEWTDMIQIRDAVHGYVLIPKPIVKGLIDLPEYQRLKDIQQTGMGVLYPTATHDRFTHSLGVYHLGCRAYEAFRNNMRTIKSLRHSDTYYNLITEEKWNLWQLLFQLACLLHDCGHSPFSHTLEFVYDLDTSDNTEGAFSTRQLISFFSSQDNHYTSRFGEDIKKKCKDKGDNWKVIGAPHERMSAYFITQEPFRGAIEDLIRKKCDRPTKPAALLDSLEFICRMIIGCPYYLDQADAYEWNKKADEKFKLSWELELQMRNCVIHMLNSALDVDNLDYTIRDAKISGYESQQIDIERLLSAFTVVNGLEFKDEDVTFDSLDCPAAITSFIGSLNTNLFGACEITGGPLGERDGIVTPIRAVGRLDLIGESLDGDEQEKERGRFFTGKDFRAKVEGENLTLTPPGGADAAQVFLRGEKEGNTPALKGKLSGILYGTSPLEADAGQERVEFAYQKSCLSVLQSAVEARNYEYLWIYAHHTTSYQNDFLLIYLLDRYAGYLMDHGPIPGYTEAMAVLKKFPRDFQALHVPSDDKRANSLSLEEIKAIAQRGAESLTALAKKKKGKLYLEYLIGANEQQSDAATFPEYIKATRAFFQDELNLMDQSSLSEDAGWAIEVLQRVVTRCFQTCILSTDHFEPDNPPKRMAMMVTKIVRAADEALKCIKPLLVLTEDDKQLLDELEESSGRMRGRDIILMQDLLAFDKCRRIHGTYFYRSTDHDLLSQYKSLYYNLCENAAEMKENKELFHVLKEYFSRNYLSCAWKTQAEYLYYFRGWSEKELDCLRNSLKAFSIPNANNWNASVKGTDANSNICVWDNEKIQHLKDKHCNALCEKFWSVLKKHNITRCVWINKEIPIKSLPQTSTLIRMKNATLRLRDIGLFNQAPKRQAMFYLYYKRKKDGFLDSREIAELIRGLRAVVRKEIDQMKENEPTETAYLSDGELVMRDVVHGDIHFPASFARLVEAKEFQRLRRIKQLATADMIFPGASHSRFAHSLGTYSIMQKLVEHFKKQFKDMDLVVEEMDWQALLAAALLHDVGHGPFSHVFETVVSVRSHEEWGKEIITDENTEVHQALMDFYPDSPETGKRFVARVCDFIHAQYVPIAAGEAPRSSTEDKLFYVFSSLVSSQLDADRMDYLLRDSYHSGFSFGSVDVDQLISSLLLTVGNDKNYYLCVREKYVPFVESYIIARFQMYRNIYYEPYKLFTEDLLRTILQRAKELCETGSGQFLRRSTPEAVLNLFDQSMALSNFVLLDDSVVMGALQQWSTCGADPVLQRLCETFLNRKRFRGYSVQNKADGDQYTEDLLGLLRSHKKETTGLTPKTLKDACGIIVVDHAYCLYSKSDWPINVHCRNGEIRDLSEVSALLTQEAQMQERVVAFYTDLPLLCTIFDLDEEDGKQLDNEIERLNRSYESRSHIEIEQKYSVASAADMKHLVELATKQTDEAGVANAFGSPYHMTFKLKRNQEDWYFDCPEEDGSLLLQGNKVTVRIRKYKSAGSGYKLTIKLPTKNESAGGGQPSRFEYEYPCVDFSPESGSLGNDSMERVGQVLRRYMPSLKKKLDSSLDKLVPIVSIRNTRNRFRVFKEGDPADGFCCEISCDSLIYSNLQNTKAPPRRDWQMEIELKSDFHHRVNLDQFSRQLVDFARKSGVPLEEETTSKYRKALAKLGLLS